MDFIPVFALVTRAIAQGYCGRGSQSICCRTGAALIPDLKIFPSAMLMINQGDGWVDLVKQRGFLGGDHCTGMAVPPVTDDVVVFRRCCLAPQENSSYWDAA
jgi:hypothetical protein